MSRWCIVAFFSLFAASAYARPTVAVGDPAPTAVGKDNDGKPVSLEDERGKPVVMTFWASWCAPCLQELPILENLQKKVGKDRIRVIAVNVDKDRGDYLRIWKKIKDFQLLVTTDADKSLTKAFDVSSLPYMVLIDKQGKISSLHVGYGEKMLPKFVDEINALLEAP